jgi:uncharacterized protein (DUF302 family)
MSTFLSTTDVIVTYITISCEKSFEQVTSALESRMGEADNELLRQLKRLDTNKSFNQVESAVVSMVGESGFTNLADYQLGGLLTSQQTGHCLRSKLYIIGNPLIAAQMFKHNPAVGLYVPLRLFVYETDDGKIRINYDKPSSLLTQFQNDQISIVAQDLDQKLHDLATMAAQ